LGSGCTTRSGLIIYGLPLRGDFKLYCDNEFEHFQLYCEKGIMSWVMKEKRYWL